MEADRPESLLSGLGRHNSSHSTATQRLGVSDQDLYDHVIGVLPKLRHVAQRQDFKHASWSVKEKQQGVKLFEIDHRGAVCPRSSSFAALPSASPSSDPFPFASPASSWSNRSTAGQHQWPNARSGVPYAVIAHCELNCHVDEAASVLFSRDEMAYDASMKALWGDKYFQRGDLLRSREFHPLAEQDDDNQTSDAWQQLSSSAAYASSQASISSSAVSAAAELSQQQQHQHDAGHIAVHATSVRARTSLRSLTQAGRTQTLCFASYTQRLAAQNEAFCVMKTLPRGLHEQLLSSTKPLSPPRHHHDHSSSSSSYSYRDSLGSVGSQGGDNRYSPLRYGSGLDHIAVGYYLKGVYSAVSGHHTRLVLCAYASSFAGEERPEVMHWRLGLNGGPRSGHESQALAQAKHIVRLLAKATHEFERVIRRRRFGQHAFTYFPLERPSDSSTSSRKNSDVALYETPESCRVCNRRFGILRRDYYCQLCGHMVCRECCRRYEVELIAGKVRKNRVCYPCVARVDSSIADIGNERLRRMRPALKDSRGSLDLRPPVTPQSCRYPHAPSSERFNRARSRSMLRPEATDRQASGKTTAAATPRSGRGIMPINHRQPCAPEDKAPAPVMPVTRSAQSDTTRQALDTICELAALRLKCTMAYVAVVMGKEQHLVGSFQLTQRVLPLSKTAWVAMDHQLQSHKPTIMKHPMRDVLLRRLPLVQQTSAQFYASFPILSRDGNTVLATLGLLDLKSREHIAMTEYAAMQAYTKLAADLFYAEPESGAAEHESTISISHSP